MQLKRLRYPKMVFSPRFCVTLMDSFREDTTRRMGLCLARLKWHWNFQQKPR